MSDNGFVPQRLGLDMTDSESETVRHPVGERTLLAGGRVKIPESRLGVERGDEVDLDVEMLDSGLTVEVRRVEVHTSGRVTIPAEIRNEHEMGKGDRLALTVYVERR